MPSLLELSAELKLAIFGHIDSDRDAIWSVGTTCRSLRSFVAPLLFKRLVLGNNEKSAWSIQTIAEGPYAGLVHELHFQAIIAMPKDYNTRDSNDPPPEVPDAHHFPECVTKILGNLARFPKLEKLIIEFPVPDDDYEFGFYHFEELETYEQNADGEAKEAWRWLMARAFEAVGKNEGGLIPKVLELRNLVAKIPSSWTNTGFSNFLRKVDSFIVSLRGGDNGAGWCINTNQGYLDFVSKLSSSLFQYLESATYLSFMATEDGLVGLQGMHHVSLPLYGQYMPSLRELKLRCCFVGPELVDFIKGHSATLEAIQLQNCFAGTEGSAENPITWADLFDGLLEANLPNLRIVDIEIVEPWESSSDADYTEDFLGRVQRETEESKGRRRMFAYASLDDKYGMLFRDEEMEEASFVSGADQAAWERLLDAIEANKTGTKRQ